METDATRMCALLVGLPDVRVVGVGEWPQWLRIVISMDAERPSCCGRPAHRHGVRDVVLVDLPVFGVRPGWCGASSDGAARRAADAGPSRTRGSHQRAAG